MTARGASSRRKRASAGPPWAERPLRDTGLPPRILAALEAAGCRVCGDWCARPEAAESPRLSEEDRVWARRVAGVLCKVLEAGRTGRILPPMPFARWLGVLLPERWRVALSQRRALDADGAAPALHEVPLARVGTVLGITRERVRQLLEMAGAMLAAPLARHLAAPLCDSARGTLEAAGGCLMPAEWVQSAEGDPLWSGVSPTGALLILHEAAPERIGLHRDLFTSLSPDALDALEARLRDALRQAGGLFPLGTLDAVPDGRAAIPPATVCLYGRLARRMPGVLALRDGRAGWLDRDAPRLLHEILLSRGPMHLDALAAAYNVLVHPESQRGVGLVRQWVLSDPAVRRTAPGVYGLAPGFQPSLFAGHGP